MSKHSIEIQTLLKNKSFNNSLFNREASFKTIPHLPTPSKILKRSQSSSSLRKLPFSQMLNIEERYKKLEINYRAVLQQTKTKAALFAKQKIQLEKYQVQSIKDKKQIQILNAMLGFLKKQDFGVQVNQQKQLRSTYDKDSCNISGISKVDQSTDAGLRQTIDNWKIQDLKRSIQRRSRVKTPYKLVSNKSSSTLCFKIPLEQSNIKSSNFKYKFIPTMSLN